MAAAALVVAAIVVGAPADAAVTADAAPRDLRPVQECADLAAWLVHLGGSQRAARKNHNNPQTSSKTKFTKTLKIDGLNEI